MRVAAIVHVTRGQRLRHVADVMQRALQGTSHRPEHQRCDEGRREGAADQPRLHRAGTARFGQHTCFDALKYAAHA
jgi:hypothetical protein